MAAWSSGLFDCFNDCGICFYGYCCTPCLYGENAEKIDGSSCCGSCCVWVILADCGLCCLVHMGKRRALRQRYGLQEDCDDCCATTFCTACAVCQEARELKYRSAGVGGPAPIMVQPTGGNMYPPPGGNMYPQAGGNMYPQAGGNMYPVVGQPGTMREGQY